MLLVDSFWKRPKPLCDLPETSLRSLKSQQQEGQSVLLSRALVSLCPWVSYMGFLEGQESSSRIRDSFP